MADSDEPQNQLAELFTKSRALKTQWDTLEAEIMRLSRRIDGATPRGSDRMVIGSIVGEVEPAAQGCEPPAQESNDIALDVILDVKRQEPGPRDAAPLPPAAMMLDKKPEVITEPRVLTPEQTAELLDEVETMLERHIPARQYLRVERDNESFLKEHYPQYLDPAKEEGKRFAAFERQFPQIKQFFPQWRGILAEVVRGSVAFHERRDGESARSASESAFARASQNRA